MNHLLILFLFQDLENNKFNVGNIE